MHFKKGGQGFGTQVCIAFLDEGPKSGRKSLRMRRRRNEKEPNFQKGKKEKSSPWMSCTFKELSYGLFYERV